MRSVYLSSPVMTVYVLMDDRYIIRETAPIVSKFRGQQIVKLYEWMKKQGKVEVKLLDEVPEQG